MVAVLYGLAWLFATRWRRLADRDLETEQPTGPESDGDERPRRDRATRRSIEGTA